MKQQIAYFQLPLNSIPFEIIPSLEELKHKYVYCSSFPLRDYMGLDFYLVSVFDVFDEIKSISELQNNELLFGKVVSYPLSMRGKAKCLKIGCSERIITKESLPDLRYNSSGSNPLLGNWFYMKEGKYVIFSGIKSEYEKVKHLEGIAIYGDSILRLRIVIELLKRNVSRGLLKLTEQDYKDIAYNVLKADPVFIKSDDATIKDGINNWVPAMLLTPCYGDIPIEHRGKALL